MLSHFEFTHTHYNFKVSSAPLFGGISQNELEVFACCFMRVPLSVQALTELRMQLQQHGDVVIFGYTYIQTNVYIGVWVCVCESYTVICFNR